MIPEADLAAAREVVRSHLAPTPLTHSEYFSQRTGAEVYLKLENLQRTGSFKVRGALCRLVGSPAPLPPGGVVAASAGNHAQGVALAASRLGVPATVVMPENAPIGKQLATREYGARVVLHGADVAEALAHARTLEEEGCLFVHPFDDPLVIAGQATVGSEVMAQLPGVEEIWAPVGGGGLLAGIALAVPEAVRLVAVQTAACPSLAAARRAGAPAAVRPAHTIADGIAVPRVGEMALRILAGRLAEAREVEESSIALAMVELLEKKKLLAEGAGAAALAALLAAPAERVRGRRIAVVISGGNVDLNTLDRVLELGLMRTGRMLRFAVVLDDRPGALAGLLQILTAQRANVLHVAHDRLAVDLPLGRTRVALTLETRGADHNRELTAAVAAGGYRVEAGR